eukprot:TRINITY_DN75086_c0_g1_i1.p1 TRINITY_DN75086_c0_g1~~TRINITY_DN75086_c0_g1_i1.p1  ORF type:complete len:807 (+),score=191.80 TRINITY_DN75086_c0_g1_i1:166-2586(+)
MRRTTPRQTRDAVLAGRPGTRTGEATGKKPTVSEGTRTGEATGKKPTVSESRSAASGRLADRQTPRTGLRRPATSGQRAAEDGALRPATQAQDSAGGRRTPGLTPRSSTAGRQRQRGPGTAVIQGAEGERLASEVRTFGADLPASDMPAADPPAPPLEDARALQVEAVHLANGLDTADAAQPSAGDVGVHNAPNGEAEIASAEATVAPGGIPPLALDMEGLAGVDGQPTLCLETDGMSDGSDERVDVMKLDTMLDQLQALLDNACGLNVHGMSEERLRDDIRSKLQKRKPLLEGLQKQRLNRSRTFAYASCPPSVRRSITVDFASLPDPQEMQEISPSGSVGRTARCETDWAAEAEKVKADQHDREILEHLESLVMGVLKGPGEEHDDAASGLGIWKTCSRSRRGSNAESEVAGKAVAVQELQISSLKATIEARETENARLREELAMVRAEAARAEKASAKAPAGFGEAVVVDDHEVQQLREALAKVQKLASRLTAERDELMAKLEELRKASIGVQTSGPWPPVLESVGGASLPSSSATPIAGGGDGTSVASDLVTVVQAFRGRGTQFSSALPGTARTSTLAAPRILPPQATVPEEPVATSGTYSAAAPAVTSVPVPGGGSRSFTPVVSRQVVVAATPPASSPRTTQASTWLTPPPQVAEASESRRRSHSPAMRKAELRFGGVVPAPTPCAVCARFGMACNGLPHMHVFQERVVTADASSNPGSYVSASPRVFASAAGSRTPVPFGSPRAGGSAVSPAPLRASAAAPAGAAAAATGLQEPIVAAALMPAAVAASKAPGGHPPGGQS